MSESPKAVPKSNFHIPEGSEWLARFGEIAERLGETPTLCRTPRRAHIRLKPRSEQELREVIGYASLRHLPLYPVSTGRNWGYGSYIPPTSNAAILELSGFSAISQLDRSSLSVRIEPGVTQEALHTFLSREAPDLTFNVTGAGLGTSVLGNALERGIGYYGEKDRDLFDLEVILPDGSLVSAGPGQRNLAHGRGAGLSVDELWYQTNFGIVTSARLRLRPRQQHEAILLVQGGLQDVLLSLKSAYANRLIDFPTHIAEPGRSRRLGHGLLKNLWKREPTDLEVARSFPERDVHTGLVGLHGVKKVNRAKFSALKGLLKGEAKAQMSDLPTLRFVSRWAGRFGMGALSARLRALEPLLGLTWGAPTDAGLTALDGNTRGDPDLATKGAIYGNAILPCEYGAVSSVSTMLRAHWQEVACTWIVLNEHAVTAIYTLHFANSDAERAHEANRILIQSLREKGFPPYRTDINTSSPTDTANLLGKLKAALDPEGIISPGRYEPAE